MRWSALGGGAAAVAGIAWLVVFNADLLRLGAPWNDLPLWPFPLAFGLATFALYRDGRAAFDRWARGLAVVVATIGATAYVVASVALVAQPWPAYAGWLVFIGAIVVLLGLVLAFGATSVAAARRRPLGRVALVAGGAPFAFLAVVLATKVVTGPVVTDPVLLAIGELGGAFLVGGGWLALGLAMLLGPE